MIARDFIQDLLTRIDIADVVGRQVALKKAGQNFLGLCPFHSEKTPSFTVSPTKQFYHCFGCGAHGNAIGFLMETRGLGYVEAIKELAQSVGLQVPEDQRSDGAHARGLADVLMAAATFYQERLKDSPPAIDYLKGRGVTGQSAKDFALGYSPDAWQGLRAVAERYEDPRWVDAGLVVLGEDGKRRDRFRGRLMFPIRNRRGSVIGFGARALGDEQPKYLNSPETAVFRKGAELYGLFEAQAAIRQRNRVIVCEGYLDVIQLAQAGFKETVAALGTAITDAHVSALLRAADHVIFTFDGDAAGLKAARRAMEATLPVISESKRASFVLLPDGEDPDSLIRRDGPKAFERALADALPLSRWFMRVLCEGRDLSVAEERAAVLAQAGPLLAPMQAAALRAQLVGALAQATRTPERDIEAVHGLKPWQRAVSGRPQRMAGRGGAVEDLAQKILQQLWAHPQLAREFNAHIASAFDAEGPVVERQIVELWRAATQCAQATPGMLLELLADSEHADAYKALSSHDLLMRSDIEHARADLQGAFARIERRRLAAQCDALLAQYESQPSAEALAAYKAAFDQVRALRPDATDANADG